MAFTQGSCFLGFYTHAIDSQRRVAIPREWRQIDQEEPLTFYLLPGRKHTIQVVPQKLFDEEIIAKLKKVSFADKEKTQALARIGAKASHSSCDSQGRIKLTQDLVKHAGLGEKIVLVGAITTIEILTPENWELGEMSSDAILDQIEKIQGGQEL